MRECAARKIKMPEREPLQLAIVRAKDAVRLLDAKLNPESRHRRWEMPDCVKIAILKALHPELGEREVLEGLEKGTLAVPRRNTYRFEDVRMAAILAFVGHMGRMGKRPEEISDEDFRRNGLAGLANNRFGSCFEALRWAGVLPEEGRHAFMFKTKPETYSNRENRVRDLKEAQERLGGDPRERRARDFMGISSKLYNMVVNYYHGSAFEAYLDAGLVTKKDEEYMRARNKPGK